jgi:hypothetical protein
MLGMNTFLQKSVIRLRQQFAVLAPLSASLWASLLLAIAVAAPGMAAADPLHSVKGSLLWRHEFSGWLFPTDVAGLQREGFPYQLDGGDSAGVRYLGPAGSGIALEIRILLENEAVAPLEGTAFAPAAAPEIRGTRATTSADGKVVSRYLLRWQAWTVLIVAEAPAGVATAQATLDVAVEALPWRSLGSVERLH